jgi:hypothetical protein
LTVLLVWLMGIALSFVPPTSQWLLQRGSGTRRGLEEQRRLERQEEERKQQELLEQEREEDRREEELLERLKGAEDLSESRTLQQQDARALRAERRKRLEEDVERELAEHRREDQVERELTEHLREDSRREAKGLEVEAMWQSDAGF